MDYEKKYKESLEKAKAVLETDLHESGVWAIKKIFPELSESEDERIRQEILEDIRNVKAISSEEYRKKADRWIAWLEKQKEQKPAEWSEKDEKMLIKVKQIVLKYWNYHKYDDEKKDAESCYNWLKSLKDRANFPKSNTNSPSEWSEEDEHRYGDAIYFLETTKMHYADTSEIELAIDWLKSLRPQPHWKPSEEQMKALLNAEGLLRKYRHIAIASKLAELYEELKKLGVKEEPEYYQHFDPDC